jgi:hypothetical protein
MLVAIFKKSRFFLAVLCLFALLLVAVPTSAQTTLLPFGTTWKYLDNGTNQGTAWYATTFDDATWASGPAELGYGDGGEATVVSYGGAVATKHITTYFRSTVTVANASLYGSYRLNLVRDDGAVVYINGVERFRSNMPAGTITNTTLAAATVDNTAESDVNTIVIPANSLSNGVNVIAVEIHQRAANSSDISFNLQLIGLTSPTVNSVSPIDNAVAVPNSSDLAITFSEPIQKGTGNILIKESGVTTQTIDVASAAVSIAGNTVTINPTDFTNSKEVSIEIPNGVFKDLDNNDFSGIIPFNWNFTVASNATNGAQAFTAYESVWKYLDNGTDQGTSWTGAAFSDATWANGNAELGYGDADEKTIVSFGASATNKYVTTYFRKNIILTNPSSFAIISGKVKRDDGVAIYVNGTEVYRNNLAAGATYTTFATATASDDGDGEQLFTFSPSLLVNGNNIIAVEIHQDRANSSDISFDMELTASNDASLTRGPYLNVSSETAVVLRWRTNLATNTKVDIGTTHGSYTTTFNDAALTTEHEITLTGLNPDTKYYFQFGSSTQTLQAGTDNYFVTAPTATTLRKQRFAVFGDCGRDDNNYQSQTLAAYQNYLGANNGEVMVLLGDNAYTNGTDAEYQSGFFAPYQSSILKNHIIMPAPGNHDYYGTSQASRAGAYYQNFTIPTNGESGGLASGTEAYYSWNRGNVHFVSLDSYGTESPSSTRLYDTLGPQVTWLKQDLAANTQKWTILYWHHPPYTKGSHNSDTETELIRIRTNLLSILERYGVDLIMCGHSHNYERSYLLQGHYGTESTFDVNTHALSNSSAKYDGSTNSCPYNLAEGQVNHGIVYVVSGSAGASGGIQANYPHDAMPWSVNDGGMLQLEVEGNRLDAKFIRRDQVIADQFTIMKDVNKTTDLTVPAGTPTELTASWVGEYSWSTSPTTKSITITPSASASYTVTDNVSCLADVFNISVSQILAVDLLKFQAQNLNQKNVLTWQTSTEKNNNGFNIQRSANGTNFETIGFVKGNGTSVKKHSYTFTDEAPYSLTYYRLLQLDFDGKKTQSPTIKVVINPSKTAFNIYPNPAIHNFNVAFTLDKKQLVNFELVNTAGQVILQNQFQAKAGNNQLAINTNKLPIGPYILKIKQPKSITTAKITLQ